MNRFLDVEAEVDNDDDEDEDAEDGYGGAGDFIADDLPTDESSARIYKDHQRIEQELTRLEDRDAEAVARDFQQRARYRSGTARYMGDSDQVPQRLLMPSVKDAFLWQVKVKVSICEGLVWSLLTRSFALL